MLLEEMWMDLMTGENPWNRGRDSKVRGQSIFNQHLQAHDSGESWDPTALFCIRGCNYLGEVDKERLGIARGRGGWIRKGSFP